MDDAPPKEGEGVEQIQTTKYLMVVSGLFPPYLQKTRLTKNPVIPVVYLVALV